MPGIKETGYGYEPNGNDFHHTPNTTGLNGGSNSRNALKKRQSFWRTPDCANGGTVSEDALCDMADGNMIRASGQAKQLRLQDQVRHPDSFPTPQARDFRSGEWHRWQTPEKRSRNLNDAIAFINGHKLFPTPQASDDRDRGNLSSPCVQKRIKNNKQINLSMCVSENSGKLNPDWVEWLMGWPIGYTRLSPITAEILSWDEDPADYGSIPRVTNEKLHRSERIKRIGNGQCPQALVLAYLILSADDIPKKQKQSIEEAA